MPRFVSPGQEANEVKFDMNDAVFRTDVGGPSKWSKGQTDNGWRHSDLRDVALPFVSGLYRRWVEVGRPGKRRGESGDLFRWCSWACP